MSRISSLPGVTVVPAWSTRAAVSRAASVLLGAFSRRLIVDCEANGAPLSGQRPTASFINGSCRSRSRSVAFLVATGNRRGPRHHHLEHFVTDAAAIAAIRHRIGKPPAYPELALRLPQQQQAAIRGLVAAGKIDCEFLAMDRWQLEGKRYSVGHAAVALR